MNGKTYCVVKIEEDVDFGCEEREENQPVMAVVQLCAKDRCEERTIRVPDQSLYAQGIHEGDSVMLCGEKGLLKEVKEKNLLHQIQKQGAAAFTHSGKFHADDVFSTALLLSLNPEIQIQRGSQVPDGFDGIVFDIGRGKYDHHQRDSRIRENGNPYAAFGLLWEGVGAEILGTELAIKFDEEFIQPLDLNDNTGEKNELASLIGNFNPSWDEEGSNDGAFFQAVSVAGMILENKIAKYRGNERADVQVEEYLNRLQQKLQKGEIPKQQEKILILPQYVPCQKRLARTAIAFVIFPSNRGGYCIQPQKKSGSMNYKCSFPKQWLGLEQKELQKATGLSGVSFCHKGGFLMTAQNLEDAIAACEIAQQSFEDRPVLVALMETKQDLTALFHQIPGMEQAKISYLEPAELPEIALQGSYGEIVLEKPEWKQYLKEQLGQILAQKPDTVFVDGNLLLTYPILHQLRKKRIPVFVLYEQEGKKRIVRIPSGS